MQKTFTCKYCGKREVVKNWLSGPELLEKKLCFGCNFDLEFLKKKDYVIVDGEIYILNPSNPEEMQGCGGRGYGRKRFVFGMLETGKHRVCSDVWYLGLVREKCKNMFPDTAKIVYPKHKNIIS
jgi:hypothetical protein